MTEILDLLHALGYLWEAAFLFHPKDSDAARAFILGHLRVELAIIFGLTDYPLSDGALKAIDTAKPQIFRDDWRRVFDWDRIDASVEAIVGEPIRHDRGGG